MKRLFVASVLTVLVALGGISCGGGDPVNSGPGEFKVRLTSPNSGADSAITFTIFSPTGLTSVTPGAGLRLFQQPLGATVTRFALIGQLNNGATILTIGVKDLSQLSQYSGTVDGVAQPNYQLRIPLTGYALALTR